MAEDEAKKDEIQDEASAAAGPDEAAEESGLTRPETSVSSPPAGERLRLRPTAEAPPLGGGSC